MAGKHDVFAGLRAADQIRQMRLCVRHRYVHLDSSEFYLVLDQPMVQIKAYNRAKRNAALTMSNTSSSRAT